MVTIVTSKMNMAVKPQNSTVLLRRPLPPKVLSPLPTTHEKYGTKSRSSHRSEIRQKAHFPSLPGHEKDQVCRFLSDVCELHKPQGTQILVVEGWQVCFSLAVFP